MWKKGPGMAEAKELLQKLMQDPAATNEYVGKGKEDTIIDGQWTVCWRCGNNFLRL